MSKIRNAEGRKDGNSGYGRVFDNVDLGALISKVQATVISNGTELERIILSKTTQISNLDSFVDKAENGEVTDGVYVCSKKVYNKSSLLVKDTEGKTIQPDMLIFVVQRKRVCKVIELKDGDAFDTKKSPGEKVHLETFQLKFATLVAFKVEYYICCFNQLNKNVIYEGFKKCFEMEHIMTGKELCDILGIDYDAIIDQRKADATDNIKYFFDELIKIPAAKTELEKRIK